MKFFQTEGPGPVKPPWRAPASDPQTSLRDKKGRLLGGPPRPLVTSQEMVDMVNEVENLLPLPTSRFPKAVRLTLTGEEAALLNALVHSRLVSDDFGEAALPYHERQLLTGIRQFITEALTR